MKIELWQRIRDWTRRESLDRELEDELAFHRQQLERDAIAAGDDAESAARTAIRRLGNTTNVREEARSVWSIPWLETLLRDARLAARGLRRSPVFTIAVTVTLSLGLGVNVAMFSVVDQLMFRPLHGLREPSQVHRLYWQRTSRDRTITSSSGPYTRFLDVQRGTSSFSEMAAFSEAPRVVGEGEGARERTVGAVSASYFPFFDLRPALGRFFAEDEDQTPRGADVVVLAHSFWMSEFGGRDVLGEMLRVDNVRATIIGVAPPGFSGVNDADPPVAWIPITTYAGASGTQDARTYFTAYSWGWVSVMARRKPEVSVEAAQVDATIAFTRSWDRAHETEPDLPPSDLAHPIAIVSSVRPGAGPDPSLESRTALWLLVVSGLVLLLTTANVANLIVARSLRRDHETALRLSLGASRGRLLMKALVESLLLATLGAITALAVGQWAAQLLHRAISTGAGADTAMQLALAPDQRVLLMAVVLALSVGLVLGLVPGLIANNGSLAGSLRSGARVGGRVGMRVRGSLLVVQGVLSTILLIGALLFVRSLRAVQALPMGYNPDRVLFIQRVLDGEWPGDTAVRVMNGRLLAAAQTLPGVESAAWASSVPFRSTSATPLFVAGIDSVDQLGSFTYQVTTPDYFRTMETRILRGRALSDDDVAGAPSVAVVGESMARLLWPNVDPLGQCFKMRDANAPCTSVVGVAQDMVQRDLTGTTRLHYYIPLAQSTRTLGNYLLLKVRSDPATVAESLRRELQRQNGTGAHLVAFPLRDVISAAQRSWRLGATMFTLFGVLALAVAAIGLYGVIAFSVTQRSHELGVRVALGARPMRISRLVVGEGVRFILLGVAGGVVLAILISRPLEPLLFRQPAVDTGVYGIVAGVMLAVAVCASAVPAWRAARTDPATALRAE